MFLMKNLSLAYDLVLDLYEIYPDLESDFKVELLVSKSHNFIEVIKIRSDYSIFH